MLNDVLFLEDDSTLPLKKVAHVVLAILTTFRKVPKGNTSAILFLLANSMTSLSNPHPQPPVGGIPHSNASR